MELINALSSPETQMNGNFQTLEWAQVYGRRAQVTTGLTWGYYGGMWGGITAVDGTLTLTDAAANYIVVHKATGVISVSTVATNWNDTATYARVYKVTTAASVVSVVEDHRAGEFGIILGVPGSPGPAGPPGAPGAPGIVAMAVSDTLPAALAQGEQWYESDTGGFYMKYRNPDATETLISLSTTGGDFMPYNGGRGLFSDGTLAAPGISWANEPAAGFWHAGSGITHYVIGGAVKFSIDNAAVSAQARVAANAKAGITGGFVAGLVNPGNATLVVSGDAGGVPALCWQNAGTVAWLAQTGGTSLTWGTTAALGSLGGGYAFSMSDNGVCYGRQFTNIALMRENVRPMGAGVLESVLKLHGVRYTDSQIGRDALGLAVEEAETVFPEVVSEAAGEVSAKGINYAGLVAPLIEAIRELNDRLTALENK